MNDQSFREIARAIRDVSGLVLTPEQNYLLSARLEPVLRKRGIQNFDEMARRLASFEGAALVKEAAEATTTNETSFFRDDAPFKDLSEHTLPALSALRPAGQPIRVWSAACSTGQEAYSLAMIAAGLPGGRRVEIVGTDLSAPVVERAGQGFYSAFEVQRGLPEAMLARWFTAEPGGWRIAPGLRACCRFQVANLLHDLSHLGRFDIVMLRNVLLYFDPPTKEKVIETCTRQLAPDGYLYLGATETLLGLRTRLVPVAGRRGVWRIGQG